MTRTLILIFAALALMIGSFVWFVTSWDADAEAPITMVPTAPSFILAKTLTPEGRTHPVAFASEARI